MKRFATAAVLPFTAAMLMAAAAPPTTPPPVDPAKITVETTKLAPGVAVLALKLMWKTPMGTEMPADRLVRSSYNELAANK